MNACLKSGCVTLTLFLMSLHSTVRADIPVKDIEPETVTLTFPVNYTDGADPAKSKALLPKEKRLNPRAATIEILQTDVLPDSITTAVRIATDIWESAVEAQYPLKIGIEYAPLSSGDDILVEVKYKPDKLKKTIFPLTLYYGIEHTGTPPSSVSDYATIKINSLKDWECGCDTNYTLGRKNLIYAMLRAYAISLGFGSSVHLKQDGGGLPFVVFGYNRYYSPFDKLIYRSDGKWLSGVDNIGYRYNQDLTDFVNIPAGVNVYADDRQHPDFKLYAPAVYEPYRSLIYLDNPSSLLHYDLSTEAKSFAIDDTTIDLIKSIGWEMSNDVEITPTTGDLLGGVASAYQTHSFKLKSFEGVSSRSWIYQLPLKNGGMDTVCTGTGDVFTIPAIQNEGKYQLNINGDIYGRILFCGIKNGKTVTDTYRISLELKPRIFYAYIDNRVITDQYGLYNDITFYVAYSGSDHIDYSVEQEDALIIRDYTINNPFHGYGKASHIVVTNWCWVTFKVENKYGAVTYELEIPPYMNEPEGQRMNADATLSDVGYDYINVFKLEKANFANLGTVDGESELQLLPAGMYALHYMIGNDIVLIKKYFKR